MGHEDENEEKKYSRIERPNGRLGGRMKEGGGGRVNEGVHSTH